MTESGDTDPTTPKEMQQNPPNPTGGGGDRDDEAGERALQEAARHDEGAGSQSGDQGGDFVEDLESDPARAGGHSPGEDLIGG